MFISCLSFIHIGICHNSLMLIKFVCTIYKLKRYVDVVKYKICEKYVNVGIKKEGRYTKKLKINKFNKSTPI